MIYPRVVYHKNYKSSMTEKEREAHAKVVKSEADHKEYFSEWGEHPEHAKPEPKKESKKEEVKIEVEFEQPKKSKGK